MSAVSSDSSISSDSSMSSDASISSISSFTIFFAPVVLISFVFEGVAYLTQIEKQNFFDLELWMVIQGNINSSNKYGIL